MAERLQQEGKSLSERIPWRGIALGVFIGVLGLILIDKAAAAVSS